jgi:hypothetical protein
MEELSSNDFYQKSGFRPAQFEDVIDNLVLLLNITVCLRMRVRGTRALVIFLMLHKWKKADKWEDVGRMSCMGCFCCIQLYLKISPLVSKLDFFNRLQTMVNVQTWHRGFCCGSC